MQFFSMLMFQGCTFSSFKFYYRQAYRLFEKSNFIKPAFDSDVTNWELIDFFLFYNFKHDKYLKL